MLRHRAASGSTVPARLLYSSRAVDEVIYRDELDAPPTPALEVVLHADARLAAGWDGPRGRIDERMLAEVAWPRGRAPARLRVRPERASSSGRRGARARSATTRGAIRTERFGPSG